jgi:hypothetical protein
VAQRPVLEARQPGLVEQLLRAALPQQVVQLLPVLAPLRRRVQPQQQPLQRLVWWRLVLPLWLWWLLRWLRKMKQPRQVLPHPHPHPLPLPLQHHNYPAVIKTPQWGVFLCKKPWLG